MRLGMLSDVHGNVHALDAVLADGAAQGVDRWWALGDLVCAGHTHQPTDRTVGGVRAVNLGSVSNPVTDDLRASYVIVHADADGHRVEHRRVAYDHAAFLQAVATSGTEGWSEDRGCLVL